MEGTPIRKSTVQEELAKLFEQDQADRSAAEGHWNDPAVAARIGENDAVRLARGKEIYQGFLSGKLDLGAVEKFHLAMLFHHTREPENLRIAAELAEQGGEEGKWLSAAAEDRLLVETGKPQKWGTQFLRPDKNGVYAQAPMQSDEESGVTDEMRTERGVPIRAEQVAAHKRAIDETTPNDH